MDTKWESDGRLRATGDTGGVLEGGVGIRRSAATKGLRELGGGGSDIFEVPEDEWDDGAYVTDPDGVRPGISFLKVPESKVVKNRIHIDVNVGGGRQEPVGRPLAAGDSGRGAPHQCGRNL